MLKKYDYIETVHCKLHSFVMAFFNRIENETGDYTIEFFEKDFQDIVESHKNILFKRCAKIFAITSKWLQKDRTELCNQIRTSNQIEDILSRKGSPLKIFDVPDSIRDDVRRLFRDLYSQVLDGDPFRKKYNTELREHFNEFRDKNKHVVLCPMCGITDLKTRHDKMRDQYDHYLPQSIYPFSSVNFKNLVPVCSDCNGLLGKHNNDPLSLTEGPIFYPFNSEHKDNQIHVTIKTDDADYNAIDWQVDYSNPDGKQDEIENWKQLYKIGDRHLGHIKGKLFSWFESYMIYKRNPKVMAQPNNTAFELYEAVLESDKAANLEVFRLPVLKEFLDHSIDGKAYAEMMIYTN